VCLDISGESLLLAPIVRAEYSTLEPDRRTIFEVTHPSGVTRLCGLLTGPHEVVIRRVAHTALRLIVDPESIAQVNRRAHYRVDLNLKGEIAILDERDGADLAFAGSREGVNRAVRPSHLETLAESLAARRRPCVIRDLSVGGGRLSMSSPPPKAGQEALLDLAVGRVTLRNLPCDIVEGRSGATPPPFDAQVRVRFVAMPPRHEALLSRHVAEIQLEMLRKGIRE
jgi:hypothetical protein